MGVNVDLIVAAMDLSLVRMLRDAMRTADLASGRPLGRPSARILPRPVIHPEPRFEPRPVIHPTPRIEPRLVYRPKKIEPQPIPVCPAPPQPLPAEPIHHKAPIEPPWKVLPWQTPAPAPLKLKIIQKQPDVSNKGTVLDVFI